MRKLALFVEGDRDRRFCDWVLKPVFALRFELVIVQEYKQTAKPLVRKLLKSLPFQGFEILFFSDQDTAPCVSSRKTKVKESYPDFPEQRIIVVSREIESWFLAGIPTDQAGQFGVPDIGRTDQVSKAEFDQCRRKAKFDSDIDFMAEIVKTYSIPEAVKRNRAFEHLHRRFLVSA